MHFKVMLHVHITVCKIRHGTAGLQKGNHCYVTHGQIV